MNRLFISLNIPEDIIDKILELRYSIWDDDRLKWEPREKLHVTIKFIGDVDQDKTDKLVKNLNWINNFESLECAVKNFDFFYRDRTPSILWAGLIIHKAIDEILTKIDETLSDLSISFDKKKFKPHLTLLRIRKEPEISFVNKFKNFSFEPILFRSNTITLYKSVLDKSGSKYYEIKKYHLK